MQNRFGRGRAGCASISSLWPLEPRVLLSHVPLADPGVPGALAPGGDLAPVGATYPLSAVPVLHSNSSATQKLYLDFDGMNVSGTWWNSSYKLSTIHAVPFDLDGDITTFSDTEIVRMTGIWERVAEDYAPFNIDVTTIAPAASDYAAGAKAQRVLISTDRDDTRLGGTNKQWPGGSYGGIAYLNTWSGTSDQPCWVFYNNLGSGNEKYTAEAISHEAGHTFGLDHDGTTKGVEYYEGQGSGATGWAPIMGVGYYRSLVQFSQGEYASANNKEDDLAVITKSANKIGFRIDDYGDSIATAGALAVSGSTVSGSGIIIRRTDVDYFSFQTEAATISLHVGLARDPNLDVLAVLYDAGGNVVAQSNPTEALTADISTSLTAGTYYLKIDGVGKGDPLTTGYSDYGSLGQYTISGTIAPPTSVLPAPSSLSANAISATQIDLNWSDVAGETSYRIERSLNGTSGWAQVGTTGANVTTFSNTGLSAATTYYYRVFALNATSTSDPSPTAFATTAALALPTAPSNLRTTAIAKTSITLAWSDNSNNETGFRIERSTNGGSTWTTAGTVGANVTSYKATGLKRNTSYTFRVAAYNNAGSAYSAPLAISTTRTPAVAPIAAATFSTSPISDLLTSRSLEDVLVG